MKRLRVLLVLVGTVAAIGAESGCGSRGAPMPPLRPTPPAITDFTVAQRGTDGIVRFRSVSPVVDVDGEPLELDAIEVLMYAERYPAATPSLISTALERERRTRLEEAIVAAEEAEAAVEARRVAAEYQARVDAAIAAGQEPPPPPEPPEPEEELVEGEEGDEPLTAAERLLRGVPTPVQRAWREAGILPDAVLESAERLDNAVDDLWTELALPLAFINLTRPPELPDPVEIIDAARRVAAQIEYESAMDVPVFLAYAAVVRRLDFDEVDAATTAGYVEMSITLGVPSSGPVRTRYFFAVRAASLLGTEGVVSRVASLAPASVPVAPGIPVVDIGPGGIRLDWTPPAGNLSGELLRPERLSYNLYRRTTAETGFPADPINRFPLLVPTYTDTTAALGQTYVYEVRALLRALGDEQGLLPGTPPEGTETAATGPAAGATTASRDSATTALDRDTTPLGVVPTTPTLGRTAASRVVRPRIKESQPSRSGEIAAIDIYPPAPARALEAIRTGTRVTLRWDPSLTRDVAGYRVYRHAAPAPELPVRAIPGQEAEAAEEQGETPAADAADDQGGGEVAAEEAAQTAEATEIVEPPVELPEDAPPVARRGVAQRSPNPLRAAGWELLTPVLLPETRYVDTAADRQTGYVYIVEAVDQAGNVSSLVAATVDAEVNPDPDNPADSENSKQGRRP